MAEGKVIEHPPPESRAWYIFSQTDCHGLLHGLSQRLSEMLHLDVSSHPAWTGGNDGGSVQLNLWTEGEVSGPITVGFFPEARWWKARPSQVRKLPQSGRHTLERMIPGEYCVGAIAGDPNKPSAYGVHAQWPQKVTILAGQPTAVDVLVSTKFRDRPGYLPRSTPRVNVANPEQLISIRTFDKDRRLLPYCHVNLTELRDGRNHLFHDVLTDYGGFASIDSIPDEFRLFITRFDVDPERFAETTYTHFYPEIHNAKSLPVLPYYLPELPTGGGIVRGHVVNQFGAPLTEYYLTFYIPQRDRNEELESETWSLRLPVIDRDGRFEVTGLASATYAVRVRHFDYPTHRWSFNMQEVTIPEGDDPPVVETVIEVEAKERRYGRALYRSGKPVSRGGWTARYEPRDPRKPFTDSFSLSLKEDGSFRVCLSGAEKEKLQSAADGMLEVYTSGGDGGQRQQVFFSKLSPNPDDPFVVIFPDP
jgi:hypothetical protein